MAPTTQRIASLRRGSLPFLRRYGLLIAAFIVVFIILGSLLWWLWTWDNAVSSPSVPGGQLPLKDRFSLENEALKTIAQVIGGAFFLFTAYFTWKTVTTAEKNLAVSQENTRIAEENARVSRDASENNLRLAQEGQITDRFTKAIEQLGDEKLAVRLGGIYALERIAKDYEREHWPIMEVLTAYVRVNAPWREDYKQLQLLTSKEEGRANPQADIQAVLTVFVRRVTAHEKERDALNLEKTSLQGAGLSGADLRGADLRGADLRGADLRGAGLSGAYLKGADLSGAHLNGAHLNGAHLIQAHLEGAHLQGAHLNWADLRGAGLSGADLSGADLEGANLSRAYLRGADLKGAPLSGAHLEGAPLSRADLRGADLKGAHLSRAHLEGADLSDANLSDADLEGADLRGADLTKALGLRHEQLHQAFVDEHTQLPSYLQGT